MSKSSTGKRIVVNPGKNNLDIKESIRELDRFFDDLDPIARRVALEICRSYKDRRDIQEQKNVRKEFSDFTKKVKRAERALRLLERDLVKLGARIRSSFGDDLALWCSVIRDSHVPAGAPLPIPVSDQQTNYFDRMLLSDPVEPLEEFLKMCATVVSYAAGEADFLRSCQSSRLGRQKARGTFSIGGGLQYSLMRLFKERATRRFKMAEIKQRIGQVLNKLDQGGPGDSDAVRKAIERLPDTNKLRCDQYLRYHLNFLPRN